jgi:hypothetical protein
MIPSIDIKEIQKQVNVLSPAIYTHLIHTMSVKTCACIEDETKQNQCLESFKLKDKNKLKNESNTK